MTWMLMILWSQVVSNAQLPPLISGKMETMERRVDSRLPLLSSTMSGHSMQMQLEEIAKHQKRLGTLDWVI